MNANEKYSSPLSSRYASDEMQYLFSPQFKFSTWRRLWIMLAESEQQLGLDITDEQLDEMRAHIDDIDFEKAAQYRDQLRDIWKSGVSALVMAAAVYPLGLLALPLVVKLALQVLLGAAVYVLANLLLKNENLTYLLKTLRGLLARRSARG